ncbi:hypothetical protein L1987_63247 [Smallanthus sonchifolius]|uniref:Uncharacterized protein n=1 Tax=Smallanthus sonchifolius TaxID=185202 RepID=A0ACB9CCY3_9ASTR|nr:hypothetical protein L1987_63247 [Smallanthus sonchifolius]
MTYSLLLSPLHIQSKGNVAVETNFRLYAYSTSKLHCEILRLIARYMQIVSFLQQNAHPRVTERVPFVPPENITDQDVFEAACKFARELSSLLCEDAKKMLSYSESRNLWAHERFSEPSKVSLVFKLQTQFH